MRKRSEHLFKGGFFFFFSRRMGNLPWSSSQQLLKTKCCWDTYSEGNWVPRGSPLHALVQSVAFFRRGWKSNGNLWQKGNILPSQADVDKVTRRGPEDSALSYPRMLWWQRVPPFPFLLVVLLGTGERREHRGQVKLASDPGFAGTSIMTSDTWPRCFHYLTVKWDVPLEVGKSILN